VRLFVALEIPDEVRRALGEIIARLQKTGRGARWVRPEGIHVTLKFIGEWENLPGIQAALSGTRLPTPVEARFRGLGFFPHERHPQVLWAGVEASPNLAELAAAIDERLAAVGIGREARPFRPHLTLARIKSEDGLAALRDETRKIGSPDFGSMRTGEFHLFRSDLSREAARYTSLAKFHFCEDQR